MERYLTPKQAAEQLSVSYTFILRAIRRGELAHIRLNGDPPRENEPDKRQIRISEADLDDYCKRRRNEVSMRGVRDLSVREWRRESARKRMV